MNSASTLTGLIAGLVLGLVLPSGFIPDTVPETAVYFLIGLLFVVFLLVRYSFHKKILVPETEISPELRKNIFTAKTIALFFVPLGLVMICYVGFLISVYIGESHIGDLIIPGVVGLLFILAVIPSSLKMVGLSISDFTYSPFSKNLVKSLFDTGRMCIAFVLAMSLGYAIVFGIKLMTGTLNWS